MNITVSGSLKFFDEMILIKDRLESFGHSVALPQKFPDTDYDNKSASKGAENIVRYNAIMEHYEKILRSDAVLVTNYDKDGIANYIGGNTFLEMGFAYVNDKGLFVLNPLPTEVNYLEEMLGMQPIILHGDLTKIR